MLAAQSPAPSPYWQSPDGRITVYHSRWEAVRDAGLLPVRDVALVHADPPYGIDLDTDTRWRPDGHPSLLLEEFPPIANDGDPFDPSGLLSLDRPSVLWGANHYASKLPDAKGWFAWDKATKNGLDLKQAEMEFAWTSCFARAKT